jgi:hypothetical protein
MVEHATQCVVPLARRRSRSATSRTAQCTCVQTRRTSAPTGSTSCGRCATHESSRKTYGAFGHGVSETGCFTCQRASCIERFLFFFFPFLYIRRRLSLYSLIDAVVFARQCDEHRKLSVQRIAVTIRQAKDIGAKVWPVGEHGAEFRAQSACSVKRHFWFLHCLHDSSLCVQHRQLHGVHQII